MVAYSFKQQFAAPILSGAKRQTIRAPRQGRAGHAKPGDALQLYTAMRTKYCMLIGRAKCTVVLAVTLDFTPGNRVMTGGAALASGDALDEFARMDGFAGWSELRAFWAKEHPGANYFNGMLIRWTDFIPNPDFTDRRQVFSGARTDDLLSSPT